MSFQSIYFLLSFRRLLYFTQLSFSFVTENRLLPLQHAADVSELSYRFQIAFFQLFSLHWFRFRLHRLQPWYRLSGWEISAHAYSHASEIAQFSFLLSRDCHAGFWGCRNRHCTVSHERLYFDAFTNFCLSSVSFASKMAFLYDRSFQIFCSFIGHSSHASSPSISIGLSFLLSVIFSEFFTPCFPHFMPLLAASSSLQFRYCILAFFAAYI